MTGTAYPGDAVAGVPTYTATQGRTALAGGQGGGTAARPLGGFSGVRYQPGIASIATASSTTWTVTPFNGYIDLESPGTTGGYFFSFQANETGAVTAAAGSARVDLLYVQVSDSNTGDGSGLSPRAVMGYQAGTAGAGIPTLSAARAVVIAQINVPASGGGAPTVSWVAPYTVAAGGILPANSSTTYPAAATYPGQYVDDLSTATLLRSNGTSWVPIGGAPVFGTISAATGYTVQSITDVRVRGGECYMNLYLLKNTGNFTSNTVVGTLPVGFRPVNEVDTACVFGNVTNGWVSIATTGAITIYFLGTATNSLYFSIVFRVV